MTACSTAVTRPAHGRSSCSNAWQTSTGRCASATAASSFATGPLSASSQRLAEEIGAEELHFTADITPFARQRGERVRKALDAAGLALRGHPGLSVINDVGAPLTQAGKPYTVFSAFHRSWESESRRDVLGAPRQLPALPSGLDRGEIPSLASLGLEQEVDEPPKGGEHEGRKRLDRFLARGVSGYGENRDALCGSSTSRLSPYLHFGSVSAREVEHRLGSDGGSVAFRRQLCWRDFYHHVLLHFPRNATSELQPRYRGKINWSHAERRFVAWCEGRTGYPLIDAGMRQLRREGWMHNRARLVVGSFLTNDPGRAPTPPHRGFS